MPRTNAERAEHAYRAVLNYESDSSVEECISDLLGDLLHLCDESGYSFKELQEVGYRNYLTEVGEERHTVEELAVEILNAHDLPAELYHTGGGVMVAQVREHGVYVWVTEAESDRDNDGEPFMVCGYSTDTDEPDPIFSSAAELAEVVRRELEVARGVAEAR